MTAWPSFDVTISLFSQSVQKYYNNFACARFYFERIGNKCFHRGESRGIDLLPYKEERYISSPGAAAIESGYGFFWPLCGAKTVCAG